MSRHQIKKTGFAKRFDELFGATTDYEELNDRIAKTLAKKIELLQVLELPQLPLHNNEAELGARVQARVRDVSFQTRSEKGTKIKDTFLTINQTAKKLGVSFYDYVYDRVTGHRDRRQTRRPPRAQKRERSGSAIHLAGPGAGQGFCLCLACVSRKVNRVRRVKAAFSSRRLCAARIPGCCQNIYLLAASPDPGLSNISDVFQFVYKDQGPATGSFNGPHPKKQIPSNWRNA